MTRHTVRSALAGWVYHLQEASRMRRELAEAPGGCAAALADVGLAPGDAASVLEAQGVAPEMIAAMAERTGAGTAAMEADPRLAHAMEQACTACGERRLCRHWLRSGTSERDYRDFCPNAAEFDRLRSIAGAA